MNKKRKIPVPRGYWDNKETCHKAALECKTLKEFRKLYHTAYQKSLKFKWLKDICSHMEIVGNLFNRCIYVYEFSDNSAYIGLTWNLYERHVTRKNKKSDVIFKHILKTGLNPILKQITKYIPVEIAKQKEKEYITKYSNNGWALLNTRDGGGAIGSSPFKWSFDDCHNLALLCKYRMEFKKRFPKAYYIACRYKWLKNVCSHMLNGRIIWTFEKCEKEASKYKSIVDFKRGNESAYKASLKNKGRRLENK